MISLFYKKIESGEETVDDIIIKFKLNKDLYHIKQKELAQQMNRQIRGFNQFIYKNKEMVKEKTIEISNQKSKLDEILLQQKQVEKQFKLYENLFYNFLIYVCHETKREIFNDNFIQEMDNEEKIAVYKKVLNDYSLYLENNEKEKLYNILFKSSQCLKPAVLGKINSGALGSGPTYPSKNHTKCKSSVNNKVPSYSTKYNEFKSKPTPIDGIPSYSVKNLDSFPKSNTARVQINHYSVPITSHLNEDPEHQSENYTGHTKTDSSTVSQFRQSTDQIKKLYEQTNREVLGVLPKNQLRYEQRFAKTRSGRTGHDITRRDSLCTKQVRILQNLEE